jgi:tripartite-type tricarboxylate transporter receptor subunit TctC
LPGFEATAWNGIGAPRATPGAIIDTLSTNITGGSPTRRSRIKDVGGETVPMGSAEFARFIVDETEKWAKVVKFSGAKVN